MGNGVNVQETKHRRTQSSGEFYMDSVIVGGVNKHFSSELLTRIYHKFAKLYNNTIVRMFFSYHTFEVRVGGHSFTAVVEKDIGGYFAYCLELKGCHTQGDNFEEAINNIQEAIALNLEYRLKRGLSIPKFGTKNSDYGEYNL